ncbi:MAG: hypothetical protein IKB45_03135 [Clostridia bacterium]|nr:hypothetical protein [Clostridia bacterium]
MFQNDFILDLGDVKKINDKKKALGINGFPIHFWTAGQLKLPRDAEHLGPECVDLWADGGFTMAQTPSFDAWDEFSVNVIKGFLPRAAELGIKVILVPKFDRWANLEKTRKEYPELIKKVYSEFKDYPAVFGMYALDEPNSPERHEVANLMLNMQKELAPTWIPYFNLLPYWEPHEFSICWEAQGFDCFSASLDDFVQKGNADLISYDLYHPMKPGDQGWSNHFNCLRYYRECSLRNKVPFWNIPLATGHFRYRRPNYDELRWQVMTSLACGISGMGWYYLYQGAHLINYRFAPINELWEKTQGWYDIRLIHKELHKTYGDLFNNIVCYRTEFYGRAYGSDPNFKPTPMIRTIEPDIMHHPFVIGYFVDEAGDKYVMLVNNSVDPEGSSKVFVYFDADVDLYHFENGEAVLGGTYIRDGYTKLPDGTQRCQYWLAPGQEVMIKVVSDKIREYPAYIPPMLR